MRKQILLSFTLACFAWGCSKSTTQKAVGFKSAAAHVTTSKVSTSTQTTESTLLPVPPSTTSSESISVTEMSLITEEASLIEATYGTTVPTASIPALAAQLSCISKGSNYQYDPLTGCVLLPTNQGKQNCTASQWDNTLGCVPTNTTAQEACSNQNLYWVAEGCQPAARLTSEECTSNQLFWYQGQCYSNKKQVDCFSGTITNSPGYWFADSSANGGSCLSLSQLQNPLCLRYPSLFSYNAATNACTKISGDASIALGPLSSAPPSINALSLNLAPGINTNQPFCLNQEYYYQSVTDTGPASGCYSTAISIQYPIANTYWGLGNNYYGIGSFTYSSTTIPGTIYYFPTPYQKTVTVATDSTGYKLNITAAGSTQPITIDYTENYGYSAWNPFSQKSQTFTKVGWFSAINGCSEKANGGCNNIIYEFLTAENPPYYICAVPSGPTCAYCPSEYPYIAGIMGAEGNYTKGAFLCSNVSNPTRTGASCLSTASPLPAGCVAMEAGLEANFAPNIQLSTALAGGTSSSSSTSLLCPTGAISSFSISTVPDINNLDTAVGFSFDCSDGSNKSAGQILPNSSLTPPGCSAATFVSLDVYATSTQIVGYGFHCGPALHNIGTTDLSDSISMTNLACPAVPTPSTAPVFISEKMIPVGIKITSSSTTVLQLGLSCGAWEVF